MDSRAITTIYWIEENCVMAAEAEFLNGGFQKKLETAIIIKRCHNRADAELQLELLKKFSDKTRPLAVLRARPP